MPRLGGLLRKPKKDEVKEDSELIGAEKLYLKAMPLRDLSELDGVKTEVRTGNIVILRVTPLASKSVDEVRQAVDDLCSFAESINGDIARLGEERVVLCPENVRVWREKTPTTSEPIPTAA